MFELEKQILDWKGSLSDDGTICREEQHELESHLRESIAGLQTQGLSDQEAFLVAVHRLGCVTQLQQEFTKNNPSGRWRYRLFWMLAGFLGVKAIAGVVSGLTEVAGTVMAVCGFTGQVSGGTMILVTTLLWASVFWLGYQKRHRLGLNSKRLSLGWMTALGLVLVIAPVVSTLGRIAQSRFVPPSWFGEATHYAVTGGIALNFCLVAICFVTLWNLSDREVQVAE